MRKEEYENGNENVIDKVIVTRIRWIDKKYVVEMIYVCGIRAIITCRDECE